MPHEANARWQGASKRTAEAETNAASDTAAAFLDAAPERARPSLCCAEKDKPSSTTSLSPLLLWPPAMRCCTCCRAAAVLGPPLMLSTIIKAVAGRKRRRQAVPGSSAVAQPARPMRRTLASSTRPAKKGICEVVLLFFAVSDRAKHGCLLPNRENLNNHSCRTRERDTWVTRIALIAPLELMSQVQP